MTTTDSLEFLRRSLADLDDELAAGDISPADHARLRDDYVARLARALRDEGTAEPDAGLRTDPGAGDGDTAVDAAGDGPSTGAAGDAAEAGPARRSPASPPPPVGGRAARTAWRRVAWAAAVVVFAVAAGVLVARASGTRTAGQSATGDIRTNVRQQLDRCLQLSGQGQLLEAVKCYDAVLADQPSSAEAYAYRAWTLVRAGDQRLWPTAQQNLDQAVALDASYPDARVFRAVLEREQGRLDDARADLAAFDALNPPQLMRDLVDQMGLRASLDPNASASSAPGGGPAGDGSAGSGAGPTSTTAGG